MAITLIPATLRGISADMSMSINCDNWRVILWVRGKGIHLKFHFSSVLQKFVTMIIREHRCTLLISRFVEESRDFADISRTSASCFLHLSITNTELLPFEVVDSGRGSRSMSKPVANKLITPSSKEEDNSALSNSSVLTEVRKGRSRVVTVGCVLLHLLVGILNVSIIGSDGTMNTTYRCMLLSPSFKFIRSSKVLVLV